MQADRIRSLVEEVERALGPGAAADRVAAIAEAVLRSVLEIPPAGTDGPVAVMLHLPLHEIRDVRPAGVHAHVWDRLTRIGSAVSVLAARNFPNVPVRARISSFAELCAGLSESDAAVLSHRLDAAAADAGLDRVLVPWAVLDDLPAHDRKVVGILPDLLAAASRLHGAVFAGPRASAQAAAQAYGTLLARTVRAGVLDAADRLLIGTPDASVPPLPRIEAVIAAGSARETTRLAEALRPSLNDMSRQVSDWIGSALSAPLVAVCADCAAAQASEAIPSELPLRYRGWPVSLPAGWGPTTPGGLADRLAGLLGHGLPGAFRIDESPNPRSPS